MDHWSHCGCLDTGGLAFFAASRVVEGANPKLKVNDKVKVNWQNQGTYYPGIISGINKKNGTYSIQYDDGDTESDVSAKSIKSASQSTNRQPKFKKNDSVSFLFEENEENNIRTPAYVTASEWDSDAKGYVYKVKYWDSDDKQERYIDYNLESELEKETCVYQNFQKAKCGTQGSFFERDIQVTTRQLPGATLAELPPDFMLADESIEVGGGRPTVVTTTKVADPQPAQNQDPSFCNWETCSPALRKWRQENKGNYPSDWWMTKDGQPGGCSSCPGKGTRDPLPFSAWTPFTNNTFSSITNLKLLGNYFDSCNNPKIDGNNLSAKCSDGDGSSFNTSVDLSKCKKFDNVSNIFGNLKCDTTK